MTQARRHVALGLALPLLWVGTACGGDDDADGRLSKAEFIKQGDAICAHLDDASDKVDDPGEGVDDLVKFLDQIVALVQTARDDVAALSAPKDAGEVKKTLVKQLDAGIAASRAAQAAAKKNDSAAVQAALTAIQTAGEEIKSSTADYGFKVCSKSGES